MKIIKFNITVLLLCFIQLSGVFSQLTDLSVDKAISIALENNYGIIISNMEQNQASINNSWGIAGRYPEVYFNARSLNQFDSLNNQLITDLGLTWTIFNGFKVVNTKNKLNELEQLSNGQAAVIVENTIEDVILGYFSIHLEKEKLEVLKKVYTLSEDRYNLEKRKQQLGSAVTYEVLQAKSSYLTDQSSYMTQEVIVKNTIRNFNFLLGIDSLIYWNFTDSISIDSSEYMLSDLKDKMLQNNNTLKNQYINLQLKSIDIKLQKSTLYPTLSVSAGYNNILPYGFNNGLNISSNTSNPYGNINLTYSIFNGNARKKAVQIARINKDIAETEIKEYSHILTNQLLNLYDMYNIRKAIVKIADENLETAALNLTIAEQKYKTGTINSFNFRDIQLIYINTAITRLQALYNFKESHTLLIRITGGFVNE